MSSPPARREKGRGKGNSHVQEEERKNYPNERRREDTTGTRQGLQSLRPPHPTTILPQSLRKPKRENPPVCIQKNYDLGGGRKK